jgi:hypothetical protein
MTISTTPYLADTSSLSLAAASDSVSLDLDSSSRTLSRKRDVSPALRARSSALACSARHSLGFRCFRV